MNLPFVLLSIPIYVTTFSCQKKHTLAEQAQTPLQEKLAGSWRLEARGGIDPHMDFELSLEESGDFQASVIRADTNRPRIEMFSYTGTWHCSKSEDSKDLITLNYKESDETTSYEFVLDSDTMKLSEHGTERTSLFDYNVFKRTKK